MSLQKPGTTINATLAGLHRIAIEDRQTVLRDSQSQTDRDRQTYTQSEESISPQTINDGPR